jgi:hypothetical protein
MCLLQNGRMTKDSLSVDNSICSAREVMKPHIQVGSWRGEEGLIYLYTTRWPGILELNSVIQKGIGVV